MPMLSMMFAVVTPVMTTMRRRVVMTPRRGVVTAPGPAVAPPVAGPRLMGPRRSCCV
jgi:hypothetical protein